MIVYALRCGAGHGFEAWFRNSDAYDEQRAQTQVACPICGDSEIAKAPMAPRIARGDHAQQEQVEAAMEKIAELNKKIAETHDYVGDAFPEEARKIHYGETQRREIYGEATLGEAKELHDEGIAVGVIPKLPRSDS